MEKIFPVDIQAVKEYGIENWQASFPCWPVSDADYLSLFEAIDELYLKTTLEAAPALRDALLAAYKITVDYATSFYAAMMVDRLTQQGFSLSYDKHSFSAGYYDALVKDTGSFRGTFHYYPGRWPEIPSFRQRIRGWLYILRQNGVNLYSDLKAPFRPSSRDCLVLSHPESELVRFAESQDKRIRYIYPFSVITSQCSGQASDLPGLDNTILRLVDGLGDIAQRFNIPMCTAHAMFFRDFTRSLLIHMGKTIAASRRYFQKIDKTDVLISKLGGTIARIVCAAGRREGFNIVGLTHGEVLGLRRTYNHAYELINVNTYLAPTEEAVRLWYKSWDRYIPSSEKRVEILSFNTTAYQTLWEDERRKPLPASIENTMFIEFPLTEFRYPNTLAFWPYQLDFIIRLASCIRKLGIKLIMKRHPDQLKASSGIYHPYFDELVDETFETVYERAHAFLFTNISTSTLYFALLTNKPVVLFDFQLEDMWEEVREPLRKRCRVVSSWFDDNGKVMFDEDALADALTKKPEQPDEAFARQFMFS